MVFPSWIATELGWELASKDFQSPKEQSLISSFWGKKVVFFPQLPSACMFVEGSLFSLTPLKLPTWVIQVLMLSLHVSPLTCSNPKPANSSSGLVHLFNLQPLYMRPSHRLTSSHQASSRRWVRCLGTETLGWFGLEKQILRILTPNLFEVRVFHLKKNIKKKNTLLENKWLTLTAYRILKRHQGRYYQK